MTRRHAVIVLGVALLAAALLCGCERTAESTAAERVATTGTSCPQSGEASDPLCSAAGADCSECPAMAGTEVAQTEAETHTCPYAPEQGECPEECACPKVASADGGIVCEHHASCPAVDDPSACPHAVAKDGAVGSDKTYTKTAAGSCPKTCPATGTCPKSGESS